MRGNLPGRPASPRNPARPAGEDGGEGGLGGHPRRPGEGRPARPAAPVGALPSGRQVGGTERPRPPARRPRDGCTPVPPSPPPPRAGAALPAWGLRPVPAAHRGRSSAEPHRAQRRGGPREGGGGSVGRRGRPSPPFGRVRRRWPRPASAGYGPGLGRAKFGVSFGPGDPVLAGARHLLWGHLL